MIAIPNMVPRTSSAIRHDDEARFLFLGRLSEEKGVQRVLEAFLHLDEKGIGPMQLWVVGGGELETKLRALVDGAVGRDRIKITGFIKGEALKQVLSQANVLVLPTTYPEGFPLAFLECAERGMAVIITEDSAIPTYFKEGVEYIGTEPYDISELAAKMQFLVHNPGMRQQIGSAARQAVWERCSIEVVTRRFAELYHNTAMVDV